MKLVYGFFALILGAQSSYAAALERQWLFDENDTDSYLVFGVPESDDVGFSFWCSKQSGLVSMFIPGTTGALKTNSKAKVTVEANGRRFSFPGKVTAATDGLKAGLEVTVIPDDPVFTALQKSDRVALTTPAASVIFPLAEADLASLLKLCRKP